MAEEVQTQEERHGGEGEASRITISPSRSPTQGSTFKVAKISLITTSLALKIPILIQRKFPNSEDLWVKAMPGVACLGSISEEEGGRGRIDCPLGSENSRTPNIRSSAQRI